MTPNRIPGIGRTVGAAGATSDGERTWDWNNVEDTKGIDLATGSNDDSYKGGVKEDTECPDEVTGSIPNNKSDLLTLQAWEEPGNAANPVGYFNFAWSRVSDPSGTTLMDFEFNQSATACAQGPNVTRTEGDLLIEYAITQGGATATILAQSRTTPTSLPGRTGRRRPSLPGGT